MLLLSFGILPKTNLTILLELLISWNMKLRQCAHDVRPRRPNSQLIQCIYHHLLSLTLSSTVFLIQQEQFKI
jgi:hypothetical protein